MILYTLLCSDIPDQIWIDNNPNDLWNQLRHNYQNGEYLFPNKSGIDLFGLQHHLIQTLITELLHKPPASTIKLIELNQDKRRKRKL